MATNYKNILLKDSQGQPLLPITLSYYVEYKGGVDVRSYLDTLSHDVDSVNSYIDNINAAIAQNGQVSQNIIATVNEILESYIQRPDHTANIQFDNTAQGLSTNLSGLQPAEENGYVTAQQAIEALDKRIESAYTYLNTVEGRITTAESDIDALETSVGGLDTRLGTAESDIDALETKVNGIFTEEGALDISASAIKYTGSSAAGTATSYNVQSAIDTIGTKLEGFNASMEAIEAAAGVTYVTGLGGILVNGENDSRKQGSVIVSINLGENGKLKTENGVVTVDESKLDLTGVTTYASSISGMIPTSQIEGGLTGDNITISYSYTDTEQVVHNDGEKSVQEFYTETQTTLETIQSNIETLNTSYQVTLTDDQGANSAYARVYTLNQNGAEIGTINIPKDQFLKKVEYAYAADGTTPALVFTWNSSNPDATNNDTTYVPISSFVDAITGNLDTEITALDTRVESLENADYITGITVDGNEVTPVDGVVALSYNIKYEFGTSTDGVSNDFLEMHGIPVSTDNP